MSKPYEKIEATTEQSKRVVESMRWVTCPCCDCKHLVADGPSGLIEFGTLEPIYGADAAPGETPMGLLKFYGRPPDDDVQFQLLAPELDQAERILRGLSATGHVCAYPATELIKSVARGEHPPTTGKVH